MAEEDKRCRFCEREVNGEECCIFHSPKIKKDAKLFQKKLDEIFANESLEIYDLSHFVFPEGTKFPLVIGKNILFIQASFQAQIEFSKIFESEVDFREADFQDTADFSDIQFKGLVNFSGATFHKSASFLNATFREVNFSEAIFEDLSNFDGATVQADFPDIKFKGLVDFHGATFHKGASFLNATFREANFSKAIFDDLANFNEATFKEDCSYKETIFKKMSDFSGITFQGVVSFNSATFEDSLVIDQESKDGVFSSAEVDFRSVRFLKPELVRFRKVNLSKFRFLETDLRKVEFVNVDWYKKSKKGGVNRIYDEIKPAPDPKTGRIDYRLIAQIYKRLRTNYEENLNYAEAGDFHIGEMKMRTEGEKNKFNKLILTLYWIFTNYGESFRRPLYWIILLIFLFFPVLFMYSGIEEINIQNQPAYHIDYYFDIGAISLKKAWNYREDYFKTIVYSFSVFSLVREKRYRPINDLGHIEMVLESILIPVFVAFFLLALRRRFRR